MYNIYLKRRGRIFKPRFEIILFQNFRYIEKLGTVYPLNSMTINKVSIKAIYLNIERIKTWVFRGVNLPKWLNDIYLIMDNPSKTYQTSFELPLLRRGLIRGDFIFTPGVNQYFLSNPNTPSPKLKFFRGKYILRHWLRAKMISQRKPNTII
jgi:ribosomal protein S16